MSAKTVAFSVSLGRYARSLLRSRLLADLLSDSSLRAAVFSPGAEDPEFVREFSRDGQVRFFPMVEEAIGGALWEKALWKASVLSSRSRPGFRAMMRARHQIYRWMRPAYYREHLNSLRPDLLVTASAGFSTTRDVPLIREARARGIPTLYVVHSWDNLNGVKGLMLERPDRLAVWSQLMKEQAVQLYHYDPDQVEVVGALQLDHFFDPTTFLSREQFFRRLHLDPGRPLILVATGIPGLDSGYLIETMIRAQRQGRMIRRPQLVVRPHPQVEADRYRQLEASANGDLRFDRFFHSSDRLGWDPTLEESIHVANLVRHSDVVVNVASTITLEACLADTPVVNVAFHPTHPKEFHQIVHQYHWQRHFKNVRQSEATWIASDEEMLFKGINRFLEDPTHLGQERKRMVGEICGPCDGKAHERVSRLIRNLMDGRWKR